MNRKYLITLLSILVLIIVSAYFYFNQRGYEIRITEEQIREKLEKKLPLRKTYFIVLSLTLDNPRVELKDDSNRVNAGLDATLDIKLNKNTEPLKGKINISGAIQYRNESKAFYLTDPVIESLNIEGTPEKYTGKVKDAASKLLINWSNENPIYELNSADTKQAAAKILLKEVVIENKELVLKLGL